MPVHIETHRDRIPTDLFSPCICLDYFPDLRLTETCRITVGGASSPGRFSDVNHRLYAPHSRQLLGFSRRVASREQVQIQISFPHPQGLGGFVHGLVGVTGFRSWRKRAPKDATLDSFLCELGREGVRP